MHDCSLLVSNVAFKETYKKTSPVVWTYVCMMYLLISISSISLHSSSNKCLTYLLTIEKNKKAPSFRLDDNKESISSHTKNGKEKKIPPLCCVVEP